MSNEILKKACELYLNSGVSIIPINAKTKRPASWLLPQAVNAAGEPLFYETLSSGAYIVTTKDTGRPKGTWEPYMQRFANQEDVKRWLRSGIRSIAMVCGKVSGGVEILDFDNRKGEAFYTAWCDLVGDPVKEHGLPLQQTGGMGYQLAWRCEAVESNQKLAWIAAPEEELGRKAMIETRGEGGYALLPPSLHPSGRHYTLLSGRFSQIPTITKELRQMFLECARQLNQVTVEPVKANPPGASMQRGTADNDVIDAYNQHFRLLDALERYNYTHVGGNRWSRPGKADSCSVVVCASGKAYSYSSNDKMDGDRNGTGKHQPFTAFDLLAIYDHDDDYKAAVKAAAKELGIEYKLHTLIFVQGRDNAAVVRGEMFKYGWVARYFEHNKVNATGIDAKGYENILVWAYESGQANSIAAMIPGVSRAMIKY